jgi:hypothetical protein
LVNESRGINKNRYSGKETKVEAIQRIGKKLLSATIVVKRGILKKIVDF